MYKIHIQCPKGDVPPMHLIYASANWLARDDIHAVARVLIGGASDDEEYHVEVTGEMLMLMGQAPALYINVKRIPD